MILAQSFGDRVQRTGFRGQGSEDSDWRGQKTEKPSARFFVLTRREAPKRVCLLSSVICPLSSVLCPLSSAA
ncbi:MAG: hypothetical protein LBD06_04180 [Candidatus Accumulibacter sp.]|nr:hypothetical protein [Accumulibacter sp.]